MIKNNTKAQILQFPKNHTLYKEGDPVLGLSILYLKKGKVELSYRINNKKNLKIEINEGNIFGLFEALSSGQKRITSAEVIEESVIWLWKKDDFLLNSNVISELGLKAIFCLSNLLRTVNQTIKDLG